MPHDVITIGGSAGAIEVLLGLASSLPADLPAAVFIVVHTRPTVGEPLPEILSRRGPLPASHPVHGQAIAPGHIYVAPPDNHLILRAGSMAVVRGPRENGQRPAVDALFRSASTAYGSRVVGVVLSGYQQCGSAGLLSIKARGGIGIAQSPDTAAVPDMPRSAIAAADVDFIVPPDQLAALLVRLATATTAAAAPPSPPSDILALEGQILGRPAELVCPTCQGVLTEVQRDRFEHFRCHVGHTFSIESLVSEQSEEVERALWAAVRALDESAALAQRLSVTNSGELGTRFSEKAGTQRRQAQLIREMLLYSPTPHGAPPPKVASE